MYKRTLKTRFDATLTGFLRGNIAGKVNYMASVYYSLLYKYNFKNTTYTFLYFTC